MRLEKLHVQNADVWMGAPLERSSPEEDWIIACEAAIIPASLMRLYRRANYLSFGAAPPYLTDDRHQLFSYFGLMLRGIKDCLQEAQDELTLLIEAEGKVYDQGKKVKGLPWEKSAPIRSKRHMRLFLLSICSSLDCIAELIALIIPDQIPGLVIGRADFTRIENWLAKPLKPSTLIVSPQSAKIEMLYERLKPIVLAEGDEKEWLPLAKLLRNKGAHLGSSHFREMGFHDDDLTFFTFMPKRWPLLWEQHIKTATPGSKPGEHLAEILSPLMRQDKVSYLLGLQAKITFLVDAAVDILDSAYMEFANFPSSKQTLTELSESAKEFAFQAFPE